SHLTGQVTHHIDPDLDSERDKLITDLMNHGQLISHYQVTGVGGNFWGRNGGGDAWYTDGEISVAELTICGAANTAPVVQLESPAAVKVKNRIWIAIRWLLKKL
ncbi:MAG TPA: LssY C-terminal domain-containing protein, partial [Chthoniobacteraceae bacterium]|nr:LssY C-terminal domain-containing protein [Chthoniobacteraceae bacterium]